MKNNIFNIKANYNFLESLSCWVIDKYGKDPIYLSQVTILLPSRRACRAFRDIILKQYKKNSIILPKIKAIGDIDIEEISLNIENITELEDFQKYSKSFLKYHSLLIEEIRSFNKKTNLFGKNPTTNQLNLIAKNLEEFLNEIDREELNLDNLENIDDADIASHKQKILLFLRNFGSNWRNILRKYQIKSETSYQNQLIDFYCQYLKNKEDNFSIIAAGSTGSLKSTSRLLKQIQKIENGFIFISSLDREISNDIFQNLTETHPQFMLKKLLDTLKISRSEICDIEFGNFQQRNTNLSKLLSYSSLPAEKTDIWTKINDITENNIENFNLIECKNTSDEATAIAIIILKELEKKDNNIALITKDKNLAKTVKNLLFRFNVNIDDSKNNNLAESEAAQYLISIANLFNSDFKVSNLLSILKHKITRAGFEDIFYYHNLRLFELKIIRENFSLKNLEIISKRVKEFSNSDLEKWFDKIINILNIFNNIKDEDNFLEISKKNLECARELSKNYQNNILLKDLNGTENIEIFINEIKDNISTFKVEYEVYCKILKDFLSNYSLEEKQNHHPRLNILSPIEARIMNFETIIVSNLNEGEFGKQAPSQNWLSKKMRLDFGLHDLSRDNGVGGFDFANYLGNKNIYLTRSLSNNNSPTEKSHHLLKLETVIKAANIDDNFKNNHYWNSLSKNFYGEIKKEEDINIKIQARPPLFNSLEKVSVTDFSKWLRDPYYIYAKRIIKAGNQRTYRSPCLARFERCS